MAVYKHPLSNFALISICWFYLVIKKFLSGLLCQLPSERLLYKKSKISFHSKMPRQSRSVSVLTLSFRFCQTFSHSDSRIKSNKDQPSHSAEKTTKGESIIFLVRKKSVFLDSLFFFSLPHNKPALQHWPSFTALQKCPLSLKKGKSSVLGRAGVQCKQRRLLKESRDGADQGEDTESIQRKKKYGFYAGFFSLQR